MEPLPQRWKVPLGIGAGNGEAAGCACWGSADCVDCGCAAASSLGNDVARRRAGFLGFGAAAEPSSSGAAAVGSCAGAALTAVDLPLALDLAVRIAVFGSSPVGC